MRIAYPRDRHWNPCAVAPARTTLFRDRRTIVCRRSTDKAVVIDRDLPQRGPSIYRDQSAARGSERTARRCGALRRVERRSGERENHAGPTVLAKGVPHLCRATLILNLGFKRVACPGLQALPLGSAHQPIYGEATSLGSIGSKSVWATRTPQGTLKPPRGPARIRTAFPALQAPGRSRTAYRRFYAARRLRQRQNSTTIAPSRAPAPLSLRGVRATDRARC